MLILVLAKMILNLWVFHSSSTILSKQLWLDYEKDFYFQDILLIYFDLLLNWLLFKTIDIIVFYPSLYIHKELTYGLMLKILIDQMPFLKMNKICKFKIVKKG